MIIIVLIIFYKIRFIVFEKKGLLENVWFKWYVFVFYDSNIYFNYFFFVKILFRLMMIILFLRW